MEEQNKKAIAELKAAVFGMESGIDQKAILQIINWRRQGLKTAVILPGNDYRKVPEATPIEELFDVRINLEKLPGKGLKKFPEPDVFLEAAKVLGYSPESCVLFDDSVPGVQAGNKANFALVVGVNTARNRKALSENGADIVIEHLGELDLFDDPDINAWFSSPSPPFTSEYARIGEAIHGKNPVLFCDYDGTLSPIVKRPEDAVISTEMQEVLKECASKFTVAIISGRDMDDLKNRVNVENLIYAGSHGFRISGPGGLYKEHEKTQDILPLLDKIEKKLHDDFSGTVQGVQVDRKRYAVAVHYRNANEEDIPGIKQKVDEIIRENKGLKKGEGKKIFEIRPDVDWHKGKAVRWIMEKLDLIDNDKNIPVYIGDDVTDEDAYKTLKGWGIGIQVGPHQYETAADYKLKNVYQVRIFLKELANFIV